MNTCFLWFHSWAKWKVIEEKYAALHSNDPVNGDPRMIGGYVCFQRRECERCGKVQLRRAQAS